MIFEYRVIFSLVVTYIMVLLTFIMKQIVLFRLQKKVPPNELDLEGRGTSCFNGESHLLYWADGHNEIAFLVPSLAEPSEVSFQMGMDESTESHSISSSVRRTGSLTACDSRTLVVW